MWKEFKKGLFTGLYAVSDKGEVLSLRSGNILKPDTTTTKKGIKSTYLRVTLSSGNKQKRFAVHRLVATAFLPNTEGKPQVNHKDGNRYNNNVENLEWVTVTENIHHAVENNLCPSGESNGNSKYTKEQISMVKELSSKGFSRSVCAKLTGVSLSCVKDVRAGRVWK